jgi:hypothetical protein
MASASIIARRFTFVREVGGANDGSWVNFFQRFTGNRVGDSWCASFVSMVLDIAYRGLCPLKRSASCQALLDQANTRGWVVAGAPQPDDLFFYTDDAGHAHHVGIVTGVNATEVTGIAGNTSEDGKSVNGTGVFEHLIGGPHVVYVRLPKE